MAVLSSRAEVPALGQRREELVDGGPGKAGPLDDFGSRQSVAGIQEEFQNIETPKDRGSQTCHSNTLSRPSDLPGPKSILQSRFEISHNERASARPGSPSQKLDTQPEAVNLTGPQAPEGIEP